MSSLKESEKRYRTLFDRSPDGIVLIDTNGCVVEFNETAHRMLGYTRKEFQGISMSDISLDPYKIQACISRLLNEGRADFEVLCKARDGGARNVQIISQVLVLDGQTLFHSIWRDVTESKQIEDKLEKLVQERTAELQIAINFLTEEIDIRKNAEATLIENEARIRHMHGMKLIGEMAAAVAHEVRNPLHALISVTEALRQELKENADLDIYLHHIGQQVERLSSLMKDLLDLGKPIEPANLRRESLGEICAAAVDHWKHLPLGQGREVSLVLPEDAGDINIIADSQRLQQVFLNLLDNAAQHSPKDGEIRVVIHEPAGDIVRVKVTDRGTGVPEEFLPKIFDPFFSTRKGGTGLGLNIVKNIVESHGGNLVLSNNTPQPGCTVEVSLSVAGDNA